MRLDPIIRLSWSNKINYHQNRKIYIDVYSTAVFKLNLRWHLWVLKMTRWSLEPLYNYNGFAFTRLSRTQHTPLIKINDNADLKVPHIPQDRLTTGTKLIFQQIRCKMIDIPVYLWRQEASDQDGYLQLKFAFDKHETGACQPFQNWMIEIKSNYERKSGAINKTPKNGNIRVELVRRPAKRECIRMSLEEFVNKQQFSNRTGKGGYRQEAEMPRRKS